MNGSRNNFRPRTKLLTIVMLALIASTLFADGENEGGRRRFGRPGGGGDRGPNANRQLPPAATRPVSYATDIQPILAESCYECHNNIKHKEGVRLNTPENLMKRCEDGMLIIAGDSARSLLVKVCAGVGVEREKTMPPKEGPLSAEKVGLLRAWIDQGAKFDQQAAAKPADLPPAANQPVSFAKDIEPILAASCYSCHGDKKQKGGLRLDNQQALTKGGDNGAIITAGKSADSKLVKAISGVGVDPDQIMPPKDPKLTAQQIALVRAWIDQGAKFDQKVAVKQ